MSAEIGLRVKRVAAAAGIGLLATVSAAACGSIPAGGGQAGGPGQGTDQPASGTAAGDSGEAASTPAGHGATSASKTSGGGSGGAGDTSRCRADQLQLDLGRTEPAAGNRYAPLIFTNDSGRACALLGYPGVTVLNGDKEQIGPDAEREPGNPVKQISLAPGESASAMLHWASQVAGKCHPTSAYLRAFPPGSTEAITIPADIQLCGDIFYVRAVTSGTDGIAS